MNRPTIRMERLHGFAFTVLRCSQCRHMVWLEAHHDTRGRKRAYLQRRGRKKMGKHASAVLALIRKPCACPKCASLDWRYVRTEVVDFIIPTHR